MVQVSYPGVYVVEVPSGVHTITGVGTSTAAFFGRAAKGPLNKAIRVTSFPDYTRAFGEPHPSSDLATSVRQFFENGGTDCYVVRLAAGAVKAAMTLRNLANTEVLVATAKTHGVWGMNLRLEVDYATLNPDDTFNLRVMHEDDGAIVADERFSGLSMDPTSPKYAPAFVSQSSALIDLALAGGLGDPMAAGSTFNTSSAAGFSQSRKVFNSSPIATFRTDVQNLCQATGHFEISVDGSPWIEVDLSGLATAGLSAAQIATAIQNIINNTIAPLAPGKQVTCAWDTVTGNFVVLRITAAGGGRVTAVNVRRAAANDLATPMMLGVDQGGIEVSRFAMFRPVPNGLFLAGPAAFTDFVNSVAALQQGAINTVSVDGANVGLPAGMVTSGAADPWWQVGNPQESDGIRRRLRLIVDALNADATVSGAWTAEQWGYHVSLRRKSGGVNDAGAIVSAGDATLGNGFRVNTRRYVLGTAGASPFQTAPGIAGLDGTAPTAAEYLGNQADQTGFYALDAVDLFNLLVIPGDAEVSEATYLSLVGPASNYCAQHRAFMLIDAPQAWTSNGRPVATAADVNNLRAGLAIEYSAVFYPRLRYSDRGVIKSIGPAGMVAGLMARIDAQRGVWKAPAGVDADLRGVLDVDVNLTDRENGILNKLGVNCIRKFPSGIVNWGARTLAGSDDFGSEWKYVPIRRLALMLEESLFRGTKWIVFQPNDEPLWAKIRMNVGAFMMGLFREGAFQGSTPDQAFYVKCDAETTTQNDRNLGIVNIEVGFAPLKPAEFVVIKIQQIAGNVL